MTAPYARSAATLIAALHTDDKSAYNQAYWDASVDETLPLSLINQILGTFRGAGPDRDAARDRATSLVDAYAAELASGRAAPLRPHPQVA